MRITAGLLRGRRLACPKGRTVRPTADRTRQAIFNILSSGYIDDWTEIAVLDLFAGTGALGLEAVSRGARSCTFVEQDRNAFSVLSENVALAAAACSKLQVVRSDVYRFLREDKEPREDERFALVFADPPYGRGHLDRVLTALASVPALVSKGAVIVLEGERGVGLDAVPKAFQIVDTRTYGDSSIFVLIKET